MVIIEPAVCTVKNQYGGVIWHIRLGFETVSCQHVAHTQQRSYSIHAESFSRTPKIKQAKERLCQQGVCEQTGMLMKQNVNNDTSKDSLIDNPQDKVLGRP